MQIKERRQPESCLKLDERVHGSIDMDVNRETFKYGSRSPPQILFHKETQTLRINSELVSPARVLCCQQPLARHPRGLSLYST